MSETLVKDQCKNFWRSLFRSYFAIAPPFFYNSDEHVAEDCAGAVLAAFVLLFRSLNEAVRCTLVHLLLIIKTILSLH